ncbi:MAG: rhomboid family intramembrane serine protease [Tepidisphaeraceae bacterium]
MGWQDRAYNQDDRGGIPPVVFKFPPLSKLTIALLSVNVVMFFARLSRPLDRWVFDTFELTFRDGFSDAVQLWRWVTYQYLHGDGAHLFFNMLGLYFFLPSLEMRWGWTKTLSFYTLGGVVGGLVYALLVALTGQWNTSIVGASGSIFAIMGAVALLYPERQLILVIFPVPIRVAVALFAGLFLLTTVGDTNLSDACHLGGLAFGFFAPLAAGPWLAKQQLKLNKWSAGRARQQEADEQQTVDQILDKVAASGMHSLTNAEKKALARASENQRKRDAARGKPY